MSIARIVTFFVENGSIGNDEFLHWEEYNKYHDEYRVNKGDQVEMRGPDDRNLILMYIYLAAGVVMLGVGITFLVLFICAYYEIDITEHLWLLAIPPASSLFINVLLIELYRKLTKR